MATLTDVLRANRIQRPEITIRAAAQAGLELASACTMLIGESGGGRMVWGSDGVATGGTYVKGGPVTQANYLAYRSAMKAGRIGRQGVGDAQLTSAEYQDRGDALGGCWDPYANQLSGFTGLSRLQRAYGLQQGFRRYNGSGPAAERYGAQKMADRNRWASILAGNAGVPSAAGAPPAPAPNGAGPASIPALVEGNTGAAVAKLQGWLNRMFPAYSRIDLAPQRYGPATRAVIAEFQRRSGIRTGDGRNLGPQTRDALWAAGYRP